MYGGRKKRKSGVCTGGPLDRRSSIFHGGTVLFALAWMRELTEPFYAEAIKEKAAITEDTLRQLLSQMGTHLAKRDFPEIKKLIASYVEKVMNKHTHCVLIHCMEVNRGAANPQFAAA